MRARTRTPTTSAAVPWIIRCLILRRSPAPKRPPRASNILNSASSKSKPCKITARRLCPSGAMENNSNQKAPSVRECLRALATPIQYLKGVGPKRAGQLASLGLKTVEDLLHHLPFRYEDRREIAKISHAVLGREASFVGRLAALQRRYIPHRRGQILLATLQDDTGSIDLVWYRVPSFLANGLTRGQTLLVHGKVARSTRARLQLVHPDFEIVNSEEDSQLKRILPVYLLSAGLALTFMRKHAAQALAEYRDRIPDRLPETIVARDGDRKSTRLNSSHGSMSYAGFCLNKKKAHSKPRRERSGLLVVVGSYGVVRGV